MKVEMLEKAGTTKILITLLEGPLIFTDLRKRTNSNISTTSIRIADLRNENLIKDELIKGNRVLTLTEKGREVAEELMKIEKIMER